MSDNTLDAAKRSAEDEFEWHRRMMQDFSLLPIPSGGPQPELRDLEKADYETRWSKAFRKITLLRIMNRITDKEVGRLVSLMESQDSENWTVCEECINQKYSEL